MTNVKMPEPAGTICFDGGAWEEDWVSSQSAYSEDQLKQYGDERAREALEMAAERIRAVKEGWGDEAEECGMSTAITTIRALAKEIK